MVNMRHKFSFFNSHFSILIISGVLLLAACGPNREKQLKAIEEQEQALSSLDMITDDSDLDAMLSLYRTFAADFPDDSLAPVYLQRAADMSISMGRQDLIECPEARALQRAIYAYMDSDRFAPQESVDIASIRGMLG